MSLHTSRSKQAALAAIRQAYPGTTPPKRNASASGQGWRSSVSPPLRPWRYLDICDPRARVMQLRNAGLDIDTHWRTIETKSGTKQRVGLYALKVGAA